MSKTTIKGEITRIFFSGDDDFVIAQVLAEGERVTIKGNIPGLRRGAEVHVTGDEQTHPKYGKQITVTSFSQAVPQDESGISRFFERVEGIGRTRAQLLAAHVMSLGEGHKRGDIARCQGVPPELAQAADDAWHDDVTRNLQLMSLQGLGLTPLQADRAVDKWGGDATAKVEANPYILCEISRIGFKVADEIARSHFGIEHDDPRRVKEGILYTLTEANTEGHTGLPRNYLLDESARILGTHKGKVEAPLSWLMDDEKVAESHGIVISSVLDADEETIARRALAIASDHTYRFDLKDQEVEGLTPEQANAVEQAIKVGGFIILTGGPGTGKTHTTKTIINAWKARNPAVESQCYRCNGQGCGECDSRGSIVEGVGRPVYLAAPTGRAAKRMQEMSGYDAQTVHRLLKCRPLRDGFSWGRGLKEIDGLVIIDEVSMLDTHMAAVLLSRISDKSTVVFVGDPDQLPSIGPGYVLHDLIESGACAAVKLTEIHRQKNGSGIIDFAYKVQAVEQPDLSQKPDFKTIRVKSADQINDVIRACFERFDSDDFRLPDGSSVNIWTDVQVLSPMKKQGRSATSETINDVVQGMYFSPKEPHVEVGGTRYYATDRVMQTSNDYEKEVYNGDVGNVLSIHPHATGDDPAAYIEFDGRSVPYTRSELATGISRAYCVTIHKSQGSEYPVVVLVITGAHHFMLDRTLLYTGITRSAKMAILIYDNKGLKRAIENNPSHKRHRALKERIEMEMLK